MHQKIHGFYLWTPHTFGETAATQGIDIFDNVTDGQHVGDMSDGFVVTILITADFSIPLSLLINQKKFGDEHTPEVNKYRLY